jgi:hypothetical protein
MSGLGEGRRYSFNELSLFTTIDVYLRVTADVSILWEDVRADFKRTKGLKKRRTSGRSKGSPAEAAGDSSYPYHTGEGSNSSQCVLCALHTLATAYRSRPQLRLHDGNGTLTDYGANQNLLECVPQYQHAVPALNAANVWMLRELANLDELLLAASHARQSESQSFVLPPCLAGGKAQVAAFRGEADTILTALQPMYVRGNATGGGYWRSLQPDGSIPAVRTIIDFHTIGSLLGAPAPTAQAAAGGSLKSAQRDEMASFVERELRTPGIRSALYRAPVCTHTLSVATDSLHHCVFSRSPDWVRALSITDDSAHISSFRPDHGTIGSYDAWPAQAIDALVAMAKPVDALSLLRAIAAGPAVREGPFGQAHTLVVADGSTESDGSTPQTVRYCNSSSIPVSQCVARKSGVWMMQAYNAASAAFANAVLRALFGVQPPLPFGEDANSSAAAVASANMARGFDGVLRGLRFRGKEWAITSDSTAGLHIHQQHRNRDSK